jgi:HEAT repeat protein
VTDPVSAADARRAAASAQRLADRGYSDDREGLARALAEGDQAVRAEAAFLLGHAGDGAAADALRAALRDESARVRVEAALALARIGDRDAALPVLRAELGGEFFADAPLRAARALAVLGDDAGWGRVQEALASPFASNRMEAVAALPAFAPLRRDDVIGALRSARDDSDELLRRDAAGALASLGEHAG